MALNLLRLTFFFCLLLSINTARAQLGVAPAISAQSLAQKLVGDGVTISNATFTGDASLSMAGHFKNIFGTNLNLDSGIILTTGRAGDVSGPAFSDASTGWGLPGDATLATAINLPVSSLKDACILEFDFVPLGDSIKFRYVFSSEEYVPDFVCDFNDAFGFFISGPGISGAKNIALVPGANLPVSIFNVNNVDPSDPTLCQNNPRYYVENSFNSIFTHDGHTVLLTAVSKVQPCQTYHMKLVISDNVDDEFDSGVFLEAKSLTSNAVTLINNTPISQQGDSYLVEGCATGSFTIRRSISAPTPLVVNLQYTGTAINGVDVQTMPASVTIPANQTDVVVNILPVIDNVPEGIEFIKVYSLAACASVNSMPVDSTIFQIRDYDTLGVYPDSAIICRNGPLQLNATPGYTTYQWTAVSGLSNATIRNPVATTASEFTTYIATASTGSCQARDSAFIRWKMAEIISTSPVLCQGASSGSLTISGGNEWAAPLQYATHILPFQNSGTFNNIPVGIHVVKVKDAAGCIDSIAVPIIQSFPNLVITDTIKTRGSCNGTANGSITVTASGGNGIYQYSADGGASFQTSNFFNLPSGTHNIVVKDGNSCRTVATPVFVDFINTVDLSTTSAPVICESEGTVLTATTNAQSVIWSPAARLSSTVILNPTASPLVTTTFYVTATTGLCFRKDSITVIVNPAPRPDAGPDVTICFGGTTALQGRGAMEYNWSPSTYLSNITDAQPAVFKPASPITYYLSVRDFNGCRSLVRDTVRVFVTEAVKMFAGNDTIVAVGQLLQLNGLQLGASTVVKYSWSPSYALSNSNIGNPVVVPERNITYTLTGTTLLQCEGSDVINVKVYEGPEIYVPSVFTPNNDGLNDILKGWAIGMKEHRYFKVFNRWGVMVHSSPDFNKGWDGKIKGIVQNTGTFVWIAEAVDFRGKIITRRGTVTIVR